MSQILHFDQDTTGLEEWEKNLIALYKDNGHTLLIAPLKMGKNEQYELAEQVTNMRNGRGK